MKENPTIKEIIDRVEISATDFERNNSELKRKYLIWNIESFNILASKVSSFVGTFGTGYPFYALDENLEGKLPVIVEQIRYNRQLIKDGEPYQKSIWLCKSCLRENSSTMPDLKQVCKPCPNIPSTLKPRKIINRLPDIDMWLVCKDGEINQAAEQLSYFLQRYGMQTSDVDPASSIDQVYEITKMLKNGILPEIFLPIDAHIVEQSELDNLIKRVPGALITASTYGIKPYIPINPLSYRKTWQHDDEAYNFVCDFLSTFKSFNFPSELESVLQESRSQIANLYSPEELFQIFLNATTESNFRRHQSVELEELFIKRMRSWHPKEKSKVKTKNFEIDR